MKKIVFTGGGSAGHVTPNMAIMAKLAQAGWKIDYIGSENGIERQLIGQMKEIPYHTVKTGKLRRYFDFKNLKDPFNVVKGVMQSYGLIRKLKPDIVFSKGGFVSVPVVLGSWLNRIPVIIHESDITPGLANKIAIPFASRVCVTFPETVHAIKGNKAVHTGSPIREDILSGSAERGLAYCGFTPGKPVLLVMGGSLGSQRINQCVRDNMDLLLAKFQLVHLCGKNNADPALDQRRGYRQFEYLHGELADVLAMTDLVVSRAGANSIFEFLALRKPMLLIPLSRQASRGDQILNADSFGKSGYCHVLYEEDLTKESFLKAIRDCYDDRSEMVARMSGNTTKAAVEQIVGMIETLAKK